MSIDEWSIDAEGKYSLKTTVYSPVVSSYMSNNPTWKRRWLLAAFKQPAASHSLHHGDRERQQTRLPRHSSFKRTSADGRLTTVYRKPTHTDQYLAYDSHHPQSVKRGIVKCLYERAKRLVTKPSVNSEEKIGQPCDSGPLREQITEWTERIENAPIRAVEKPLITAVRHALYKIAHDQSILIAWRRLAVWSRNVAIYITRDYIVRQTKNLAFNVNTCMSLRVRLFHWITRIHHNTIFYRSHRIRHS